MRKLPALAFVIFALAFATTMSQELESGAAAEPTTVADPVELTFDDLFRRAAIHHATLSPNGELIAYFRDDMLVIGKPGTGYSDIGIFETKYTIDDLSWIGADTVWVETSASGRNRDRDLDVAIRIKEVDGEGYAIDVLHRHKSSGYLSDPLPDDSNRIVLAVPIVDENTVTARLYEINAFQDEKPQRRIRANQVDTGSKDFFYYQKNSVGEYTLGMRLSDGVAELWRKLPNTDDWEHIWTADEDFTFQPWKMSDDARTLWVLSDAKTERVAAMEFNLDTREFGNVFYEHDRVDVKGILFARNEREPIGVSFIEQGLLNYEFFADERKAEFEKLQAHFPEQGIRVIGYSQGSSKRLVIATSRTDRGSIHICDLAGDECSFVESTAPWMVGQRINKTIAMDIASTDGVVVEAFLTLPESGPDSIPLIALPHGGPIGISDDRYFSPEVQWLANNGYAVLQVNYRGSGGYGKEFKQAGLRQWGRGIEDDVEAAVHAVLDSHPRIDRDRVGIFGASYGGYSAMMSVIRNPELFKCAASFAGVMDLTLLFTQSAMRRSEYLRDTLIKYIGDPDVDYEEQIQHSPVYLYKDIKRPVFLAHGMEDRIVDVEHSWRLRKMLMLSGKDPEFVLLDDTAHGFEWVKDASALYRPLVEFLDLYLKPQVAE